MKNNLLILGASSDLALSVIPKVHKRFETIFAHYHSSPDALKHLAESLPSDIRPLQADFNSEDDTKHLIEQVADSGKTITHVLHCPSAKVKTVRFKNSAWDSYEKMLNTQVRSLYYVLRSVLSEMAKNKYGKIVSILTSYTVGTPPAFLSDYIMAKYAQLGILKALAAEYADKNIQINAVSPSMMETKFLTELSRFAVQQSAQGHPQGRNAEVDDVASAVEFFLSEKSDFITGQNLLVSGGEPI